MNVIRPAGAERPSIPRTEASPFIRMGDDGVHRIQFMVDGLHCAGCISKVERTVREIPEVRDARVNMSTRRLSVAWGGEPSIAEEVAERVDALGYPVAPFDPASLGQSSSEESRRLLIAVAVAGFAAGNVMLLSVSVWAGAFSGMDGITRELFHWISALIALPAVAFAGMPFFRSAANALQNRSMNMDVPISLAVVLASAMSLQQTIAGGQHAYFDASVTLLFFLLIGRYLDHRARASARSVAAHLLALQGTVARVISGDEVVSVPARDVLLGSRVLVAAGERIPVDGEIIAGRSEIDGCLVTGETVPVSAGPGSTVNAGMLNLGGALTVEVTATGDDTALAGIVHLMETAEQGQARYVRIADRIARVYSPAVHVLALSTFAGWLAFSTVAWPEALLVAVAVLIITCPCALGLAVPVVQVVASGQLLRKGILVKAGDALERLAQVDTVVLDKTGTLTQGRPLLSNADDLDMGDLALAASMARHSRHPLCEALGTVLAPDPASGIADVEEIPGDGLLAHVDGVRVKLGRMGWVDGSAAGPSAADLSMEMWLKRGGEAPVRLTFEDQLRPDSKEAVASFKEAGLRVVLLSGDREEVVNEIAGQVGIPEFFGRRRPEDKLAYLKSLEKSGCRALMVGDGLNDGPALAAGFVSMSPSTAADISQVAADIVFQGANMKPVADAIGTARVAQRLVKQNFGLAFLYNIIAVPIAVAGFATPLVAAVAMSGSSLVVTMNAMRLRLRRIAE